MLMLDTVKGSDGERLYSAAGWTLFGEVPDHALLPEDLTPGAEFLQKPFLPNLLAQAVERALKTQAS